MTDSIRRLHEAVCAARAGHVASPRTNKLFARGRSLIAKKVAVEVALDGVVGDAPGVVRESANLLYNLVVLWAELGIEPADIWAEMRRREQMMGMAEKLPKGGKRARAGSKGVLPLAAMPPLATMPPLRNRDSAGHSGYAGRTVADRAGEAGGDAAGTSARVEAVTATAALAPPLAPGPRRRPG